MVIRTTTLILVAALLAIAASASPSQDSLLPLRGPVMGYVLDYALQAIRPVNGIAGSSVLGEPLALPFPIAAAGFSPKGDFGVATAAGNDDGAYIVRTLSSNPQIAPIEGGITSADRVFLNVDASAAALMATDARQLQVVRGLASSTPNAGPLLDLSKISGTIAAVAIDRSGQNILIAVTDEHGALYLASPEQTEPRLIANFAAPTALALVNDDRDIIVADSAVNEVTLLRNFAVASEAFLIMNERDGVSRPAGLRISPDKQLLYIANAGSQKLDVWNLELQRGESSIPLDAEPTRLTPFQGVSTFLLNDVGAHPLLLLDAAERAIYFVPADGDR